MLALSILLQGDRSEADLTELLTAFGQDIEKDGSWEGTIAGKDTTWRDRIADWLLAWEVKDSLEQFGTNVKNWGLSNTVPAYEKYLRKFYGKQLKIGVCGEDVAEDSVVYVAYTNSKFAISNYEDLSKETRYICSGKDSKGSAYAGGLKWRLATDIEKDTVGWGYGSKTVHKVGEIRYGKINTNFVYVYDEVNGVKSWRRGTAIDTLMKNAGGYACVKDSVGKYSTVHVVDQSVREPEDVYYVCNTIDNDTLFHWTNTAGYLYNDTYAESAECAKGKDGKYGDGTLLKGRLTSRYYACDADEFRVAFTQEEFMGKGCTEYIRGDDYVPEGEKNHYQCTEEGWVFDKTQNFFADGLVDKRDGNIYNTVMIGSQLWMAENLNYGQEESRCFNNSADSCAKYGRLYYLFNNLNNLCPEGWHLPSESEVDTLYMIAGKHKYKGSKYYSPYDGVSINYSYLNMRASSWGGTDDFGFSVLPAGVGYSDELDVDGNEVYQFDKSATCFWSSSTMHSDYIGEYHYAWGVGTSFYGEENTRFCSIRCLMD